MFFIPPVLNDAGQTAFIAALSGNGVDSTNSEGIWSEGSGNLALVARTGDHAPGMPSGVNFGPYYLRNPVLNDAGQTAFVANLAGSGVGSTNDQGIWSEGSAGLALVARAGDHAPGTPSDVNYNSFSPTGIALNDAGQTAFYGYLTGSGTGIWATDRTGALQLISRTGDPLEVAPGDFRTISSLRFVGFNSGSATGNSDGRPSGFNNLGQVAFYASFTDGSSGIFVSNRVAVPEPSALALVAAAALGLVRCAPRRRGISPSNRSRRTATALRAQRSDGSIFVSFVLSWFFFSLDSVRQITPTSPSMMSA